MMLRELKKYLRIVFYLPTVFIIGIYSAILTYRMSKKGKIDINNRVEVIKEMASVFEKTRQYGFHISMIFWIILLYIITI